MSKSKNVINIVRRITDLNSAHIGRIIICLTTKSLGVELFYPRKIADIDPVVEIHPAVSFDLLHPRIRGDAREVDAPLLNNAFPLDGLIMCFFLAVEEFDIIL
ncbi:hypothetical protein A2U01_0056429 [Trifolium medium]|uniref:Uncharacterized protein n=1 Tax=Trifolium medium TaxID=97028 RepID=A0A392RF22_9FABA|nr:hypothetical protein [Trifolium medium]